MIWPKYNTFGGQTYENKTKQKRIRNCNFILSIWSTLSVVTTD